MRKALRDVDSDSLAFVELDVSDEVQAKTAVDSDWKKMGRRAGSRALRIHEI